MPSGLFKKSDNKKDLEFRPIKFCMEIRLKFIEYIRQLWESFGFLNNYLTDQSDFTLMKLFSALSSYLLKLRLLKMKKSWTHSDT